MEIIDIYKKFSEYYFYKNFKILKNEVTTLGCTWNNSIYFNELVRYNHVEYFKSDDGIIEVFHNIMLPNASLDYGIFGFDIISINKRITGIFCDVTNGNNGNLKRLKNNYNEFKRERPEWANFFSEDFLIIKGPSDLQSFINDVMCVIDEYLSVNISNIYNGFKEKENLYKQNEYCLNQRKNAKTFNALSKFIGDEKAKEFIEEVLFPISN